MRLLFCGNTAHLSEDWLKAAFPGCQYTIVVSAQTTLEIENARLVPVPGALDQVLCKALFDACDYQYIIYFSNGLTPGQSPVREPEELESIISVLPCQTDTRILYLRPAKYLIPPRDAETYQAAQAVLQRSARARSITLGCPYLYHLQGKDPFFLPMFQALDRYSRDSLNFSAGDIAAFLEIRELGSLLHRFCFDSFPADVDVLELPAVSGLTMKDIADAAASFSPGWTVRLRKSASPAAASHLHDGSWLEQNCGWKPTRNIRKELPKMFSAYRRTFRKKTHFTDSIVQGFRGKSKFLMTLLELSLAALLMEVCLSLSADTVQFSIIDYRLLFVVIISSVFGLRMGLAAALIASIRLAQAYLAQGYDAMVLFYEPTNWTGFIAYFLCGISCGFAHWSSKERTKIIEQENKLLSDKYVFLKGLYDDSLTDRDTYKEQILNSRDSYGKVLRTAQMLTANTVDSLSSQIVNALEYLVDSQTVGVYTVTMKDEAELIACSAGSRLPRKIQLNQHLAMLTAVAGGDVYMNTELAQDAPALAMGILLNHQLKLLITIQEMPFECMTLAVQNLLRAAGEQITLAVSRAVDYEKLMQKVI